MSLNYKLPAKGRAKVIFPYGQGEEGKQPISAALNGDAILIPRNVEVEIDVKYLHGVFPYATDKEYAKGEDGQGLSEARNVPRFPYTLLEIVEDAGEVKAKKPAPLEAVAEAKAEAPAAEVAAPAAPASAAKAKDSK